MQETVERIFNRNGGYKYEEDIFTDIIAYCDMSGYFERDGVLYCEWYEIKDGRYYPKAALETSLKQVRSDLKYYHNEMKISKKRYGEDYENVAVREEIDNLVQKERQILKQLETTECQVQIERKIQKAKNAFKKLNSSWELMSPDERQAICRELIERVTIHKDGVVDLELKIQSYIVKNDPESIE